MRGNTIQVLPSSVTRFAILFATLILAHTVSCQLSTTDMEGRDHLARGEDQILHRNYHGAISTFTTIAESTDEPAQKAAALLGLGRAYMGLGHYDTAISRFFEAKRTHALGALTTAIECGLGEAYFHKKDYSRAQRHLDRVIEIVKSTGNDRLVLMAAICAYKNGAREQGVREIKRLERRNDPELSTILGTHLPDYHRLVNGWEKKPASKAKSRLDTRVFSGGPVRVHSRHEWNASPVRSNKELMGRPYRITVHHSGMLEPEEQSLSAAATIIKKIQRNHQKQRHWADIGYHYLIDRSGRVWEGRSIRYQGAHARGHHNNHGNIGIVLLGNFTRQRVTAQQAYSLNAILYTLCRKYGLRPSKIYTHSEMVGGTTQCPGPEIDRLISRFRRDGLVQVKR